MTASLFNLSNKVQWLLLLTMLANCSLLALELTSWMLAIISLLMVYQAAIITNKIAAPRRILIWLIAIAGTLLLAWQSRNLGILASMLNLLCFSYALKQFELKQAKDFYLQSILGIFVLAAAMIYQQSLWMSLLFFAVLILNLLPLISYFTGQFTSQANIITEQEHKFEANKLTILKQQSFKSSQLLLQSLPFALLMFFVFPRLTPFWQVPLANSAKTGLSEQVSIGDINQLVRSNELAFRASFNGQVPNFDQFYWRVLVMENFDGSTWAIDKNSDTSRNQNRSPQVDYQGPVYQYNIIAETSYQPWLFALDVAQPQDNQTKLQADFSIKADKPVSQQISYQMQSYPQTKMSPELSLPINLASYQKNLTLPANSNPRLRQLARQLRQQYTDDLSLAQSVLETIREQNYRYTLTPPLLTNAPNQRLDQFYFDSQQGFCVHYASSFTFIMRAAGIPARLVTGYMGAEYNSNGNFYSVYQRDAHAWSEVWLEGKGWTRVDPTAAVSPDRINQGFSGVDSLQASINTKSLFGRLNQFNWLNGIRLQLDALDYQWTRWIIGYNSKKQYQLLKQLFGQISLWKLAAIIGSCFIAGLALLWWLNRDSNQAVQRQPWQQYYTKLHNKLNAKQLGKKSEQSLRNFINHLTLKYPEQAENIRGFYLSFEQLEYQPLTSKQQAQLLIKCRQHFKVLNRKL